MGHARVCTESEVDVEKIGERRFGRRHASKGQHSLPKRVLLRLELGDHVLRLGDALRENNVHVLHIGQLRHLLRQLSELDVAPLPEHRLRAPVLRRTLAVVQRFLRPAAPLLPLRRGGRRL